MCILINRNLDYILTHIYRILNYIFFALVIKWEHLHCNSGCTHALLLEQMGLLTFS